MKIIHPAKCKYYTKSNNKMKIQPFPLLIYQTAMILFQAQPMTSNAFHPANTVKRPNIIHIHTDDHRPDGLNALGNPVLVTPNLDKIVGEGITFTNCYNMGSMIGAVCTPSRTMMLTGRSWQRIPGASFAESEASDPATYLPRVLQKAGYQTFHTGKQGNGFADGLKEFETSITDNATGNWPEDNRAYASRRMADHTIEFLKSREARKERRPFYAYLAPQVPHDPRVAEQQFHQIYDPDKIELSPSFMPLHPFDNGEMTVRDEQLAPWPRTESDTRRQTAEYYACITGLDYHAGRIFEQLKASGEWENTIIIFSGDNGLSMGEHGLFGKQNLYESGGMHVPLVMAGPGIKKGKSDALVYLMDLFPTINELADAINPRGVEGKSLVPILQGEKIKIREVLYTGYRNCQRAVRDEKWKLIRYPLVNVTQLFDLKNDPSELNNLSDNPEYSKEQNRLLYLLKKEMENYADTFPLTVAHPNSPGWTPPALSEESRAERDARMEWWREARFGMFIHWGAYAKLAGVWNGQRIDRGVGNGLGEWIMYNAKINVEDYAREASAFNPVEFDADAWVRLAKDAGQKYIVITTKHHDGFALFDSKVSSFNIVDHTPFKRDVILELAAACHKHGIKLGFYYSQAQDWHHPGGAAKKNTFNGGDPAAGHWDKAQGGSFDDYLQHIAAPQIRELLTNYGPVSVFWWDTPVGMNKFRAEKLAPLMQLQPGIITNNRLSDRIEGGFPGDTETPEQTIPSTGFKDRDFEVCMTMNETWGYKKNDQNWKTARELIRKLIDVASKGGNFLLNVGPDDVGRIPPESVEKLQEMGKWMHVNGEAIYGTSASPFAKLPWGRCTQKPGKLYLQVFNWPADGKLVVPGLISPVMKASLLADGQSLKVSSNGNGKVIHVPREAPDPIASVVCVELDSPLVVDNRLPAPADDGFIRFPLWMADIHNPGYGAEARLEKFEGKTAIVDWSDYRTFLSWQFEITKSGTYEILATINPSESDTGLKVEIGKESFTATLEKGNQTLVLGQISIPETGIHELKIYPVKDAWKNVIVHNLTLSPLKEIKK